MGRGATEILGDGSRGGLERDEPDASDRSCRRRCYGDQWLSNLPLPTRVFKVMGAVIGLERHRIKPWIRTQEFRTLTMTVNEQCSTA